MFFWRDPILAPRVFTSLFGIFLVVPYYGTLKVLFDRTIAFFSSLVLVFYPLHVIQSGVTTSEAVYYFFLFGSFYYFFSFKGGRGRWPALALSALSFNIATLLRFECWIFIPFFFMLLWPKGKKEAFLFLALSVVFPCAHLMVSHLSGTGVFYSFTAPARTSHAEILAGRVPHDPRPWSWLAILWRSSGMSLVAGGLAGMIIAFVTRQKRQLAVFFLVLWSAFTVNTLLARMWVHNRYSIILALFLIPYAWYFADRVLAFLRIKKKAFIVLFLIFPVITFWQVTRQPFFVMADMLFVTFPEIKAVGAWLKNHARADETIIISADRYDVWQNNIMLQSGVPSTRCLTVCTPLSGKGIFEDKGKFESYLLTHRTKYLVLNSEGPLQKVLRFELDQEKQRLGKLSFEPVFKQQVPGYGEYIIYRISY